MNPDRQTAIAARAHRIWQEAGRPHGQDAMHWHQAEREHDEAEAPGRRGRGFQRRAGGSRAATPARKRVAKAVVAADDMPAAPARKPRAPRKAAAAATAN